MVLLRQQIISVLLQPKIWLQQPNVLLIELKHFVVVTKYFCYPYFNKRFCWYNKTFYSACAVRWVATLEEGLFWNTLLVLEICVLSGDNFRIKPVSGGENCWRLWLVEVIESGDVIKTGFVTGDAWSMLAEKNGMLPINGQRCIDINQRTGRKNQWKRYIRQARRGGGWHVYNGSDISFLTPLYRLLA